jgi:hypothetical protein
MKGTWFFMLPFLKISERPRTPGTGEFLNPFYVCVVWNQNRSNLLFLEPERKVLRESKEPPNKDHTIITSFFFSFFFK